jgi:hypothetical protein
VLVREKEKEKSGVMKYHNPVLPENIYITLSDCFPVTIMRSAKSALFHLILKQRNEKPEKRQVSVSQIMYACTQTVIIQILFHFWKSKTLDLKIIHIYVKMMIPYTS